jgi:hypothetical protein
LSTGAKIAIGCGVAFVVGMLGVAAAVFGGLWWAKGKVDQVTAHEARIDELKKRANAVPFSEPADGLIREDRLVKFIDIRRRVFDVYVKHKDELEAMNKKEKADFSDVTKGLGVLSEVRTAQAEAQADVGMGESEYHWLVQQVYKTLWASEVARETGGKSVSQAAGEAYDKAADELEKTRQAAEAGVQKEIPRDAALTPEQRQMLEDQRAAAKKGIADAEKGLTDLRKQGAEARENARALDAPPANIALFRKYEADIKKYAMGGLEWLGL